MQLAGTTALAQPSDYIANVILDKQGSLSHINGQLEGCSASDRASATLIVRSSGASGNNYSQQSQSTSPGDNCVLKFSVTISTPPGQTVKAELRTLINETIEVTATEEWVF